MQTDPTPAEAGRTTRRSPDEHIPGRVALAWTLAGGITAGGLLVASVTLFQSQSSGIAPTSTTILFALGAVAGLFHGSVLGYLARDLERTRVQALRSLALGVLALPLVAPLAWLSALLIALTSAFFSSGELLRIAGVVLAWIAGLTLCMWAAWEGVRALKRAFLRWPERREGALILAGILAILMLQFFIERPEIWFTDLQVKGLGAFILALGATIWIALPIVLVVLHSLHKLLGDRFFGAAASEPVEPAQRI
jgi:hypothetical protein